jgi:hypothetical protein
MLKWTSFALAMIFGFAACSDDEIDSDEAARRAYLGLDGSIGKSLKLGFDGFNTAQSANIDKQMTVGTKAGTLAVNGQVDQGASNNKGMRLNVAMVGYTDGAIVIDDNNSTVSIIYDTSTDVTMQPFLMLTLRNIPSGTLDGTLMGTYHMSGDLEGDVTLNLTFAGRIMDGGGGLVVRVPGSTTVTGTATNSSNGSFTVNVTI